MVPDLESTLTLKRKISAKAMCDLNFVLQGLKQHSDDVFKGYSAAAHNYKE